MFDQGIVGTLCWFVISSPSDFIVHEIDLNMNEADQFDSTLPPLPQSYVESVKDSAINEKSIYLVC